MAIFYILVYTVFIAHSSHVITSGHSFPVYNKATQKPQKPTAYGFKNQITNVIRTDVTL